MKKLLFSLLAILFLSVNVSAQTAVVINFNQNLAAKNFSLDFTKTDTISIINVPKNFASAISVNDRSGLVNLAINQSSIQSTYASAISGSGGLIKITLLISGGKFVAPFSSNNISAPLVFRFNSRSAMVSAVQPSLINNGQTSGTVSTMDNTVIASNYSPGYIYYDAVQLKQLLASAQTKTIVNILAAYGVTYLQNNPFLNDVFNAGQLGMTVAQDNGSFSLSSIFSAAGNLDVTGLADGIAQFLVARSKEELNVAFFSKFQTFLQQYPELQTVYPTTCSFLGQINSYQYAAMLPALRSAFQKDMNMITGDLIKLRDLTAANCPAGNTSCQTRVTAISNFLNNDPKGRSIIAALIITNNIVQGSNAADAINNAAADKVCAVTDSTDKFYNVANSIRFVNLISQSLRSQDAGRTWITSQQVNGLIGDDITLKIYLGLLYAKDQQNPLHIQFKTGDGMYSLKDFLNQLHNTWGQVSAVADFKTRLKQIALSAGTVSDEAQSILNAKNQGSQSSILNYADYASSIANLVTLSVNFLVDNPAIAPKLTTLKNDVLVFSTDIQSATDIIYDIKSQNYGALVLNSSDLLSQLLASQYTFKDDYIKYGTFMANIIQAKSSAEVNAAIDAAVLPVGSASIKRETPMNIALNAYLGATGGMEYLPALQQNKWGGVAGITAPVGIAFSWGNLDEYNKKGQLKTHKDSTKYGGKSISIFVSFIDVGALASYRLQNDASSVVPEIQLKNIISPGLFFYYGFGKTPISLGLGAQFGPQLRDISGTTANLEQNYYIKIGASLVVDIPFFNIYTKTR